MEAEMYVCPACGREFSALKGLLLHFQHGINGLGNDPESHEKWAEQRGIPRLLIAMGTPSSLARLREALVAACGPARRS